RGVVGQSRPLAQKRGWCGRLLDPSNKARGSICLYIDCLALHSFCTFPSARHQEAPCGSPLMRITKSVSLPVSVLMPSSEIINEDPGEMTSEMRSVMSCG